MQEQINNDKIIIRSSEILGHQVLNVPQLDTSKINLVAEVSKLNNSVIYLGGLNDRSTTGTGTLVFTTSAEKDTYVSAISIGGASSVAADNTKIVLFGVFGGATRALYTRHKITLTADNFGEVLVFNPPLKLDRNTNVTLTNAFTAGASITSVNLFGFLE